jgi:hypothetical protein
MTDNWKERSQLGHDAYQPLNEASGHSSLGNFTLAQVCTTMEDISYGIRNATADDIQRLECRVQDAKQELQIAVSKLVTASTKLAAYRRAL